MAAPTAPIASGDRVRLAPPGEAPARHGTVLCAIPGHPFLLIRPEGAGAAARWIPRDAVSPGSVTSQEPAR